MRRLVVIALLLICTISPIIGNTSANTDSTDDNLEIVASDNHIIHRGETIEASITVRNVGDETTIIDFSYALPDNISISNLPNQFTLNSGQVRMFKFYYTCDEYAPYNSVISFVNITSDSEVGKVYSNLFNLIISKDSDLQFGVDDDSEFIVDPGLRTNLAVNMTNHGMFTDDVSFSISTNSNWQWGWTMDNVQNGMAMESFQSGELKFIRMWIDIPQVIDSNPLYLSGPRFSLTATSGLDLVEVTWSFELLMSEFRNVSLSSHGDDLLLDPDSNNGIPVTIRNSGNVENLFTLDLQIIDSDGNVIDDIPISDRIEYNGWTVAIFGGYEEELLMPTNSRTFEVGFQSPNTNSGEINVRVKITPNGALSRAISVDLTSQIIWDRAFETELLSQDCTLLPGESCNPEFRIFNDGNYQDQFTISTIQIPEFVTLDFEQSSLEIPKNTFSDIDDFTITAKNEVEAFSNSQVIFQVYLTNEPSQVKNVAIDIVIAPKIDWSIQDLTEEEDALGRFNIAMTLRNDGNAADGIIVQLQCSHFTQMTLIPPVDSIVESGVEFPRSFEINDIEFGSNFTVRAWAEIPTEQTSNGTMYLNVSIRSSFAPDEPISFTTNVGYKGVPWQQENSIEEEDGLVKIFAQTTEFISSWKWIILSVVASTLIIGKALRDRKLRTEQDDIFSQINNKDNKPEIDDWMSKFDKKNDETISTIESPQISPENFERGFKSKSIGQKPVTEPVNEKLRDAASLVLDTHDKSSVVKEADELLDSINAEGINSPAEENTKLEAQQYTSSMTQRNDPQNLLDEPDNDNDYTKSVPLPEEDDLDF